jgi:hypothetical protein
MQNVVIILANVTILITFCSALKGVMLPVSPGIQVDLQVTNLLQLVWHTTAHNLM